MQNQESLLNISSAPQNGRAKKKLIGLGLISFSLLLASIVIYISNETKSFKSILSTPAYIQEEIKVESWVSDAFYHWTSKYGKLYGSSDEKSYRLLVFRQNVFKIKEHYESPSKNYEVSVNEFADLTQEEFKAKYLTYRVEDIQRNTETLSTEDLPAEINWIKKGVVNNIKNQGQCGSCWAFSAIAAVEGIYAIQNGELKEFSEQQLVDCAIGEQYGNNQGCNGGMMDSGFQYIIDHGIETESDYPYKATDQRCKATQTKSLFKLNGFKNVQEKNNLQLQAAVAQQPVSVAIQADSFQFQFYSNGVFDYASCGTELNHGVTIVGYESENNLDYWLVRNSWGSQWGLQGYIKIKRDNTLSDGVCGIALMASYPYV